MHFHPLRSFLVAVAMALLSPVSTQAAKKPIDFSDFAGTYRGQYSINDGESDYAGQITVKVRTPEHGKKLTVQITGQATGPKISFPIAGKFMLGQKIISGDNLMMGIGGTPIATLTSKFSGKKKRFGFTLTAAPGAQFSGNAISGAIDYDLIFGKRRMSIKGLGTLLNENGAPFLVPLRLNATRSGK